MYHIPSLDMFPQTSMLDTCWDEDAEQVLKGALHSPLQVTSTVTQVFTVKMRAICRESSWVGPFAFQLILEVLPVFLPCSQQCM